jgi:hypothetical protein
MHSGYSGRAVSLLAFLPLMLNGQRTQENIVPLTNWPTPLFWQPSPAEREVAGKDLQQLRLLPRSEPAHIGPALIFVAITPCRLVDTRGIAGGFNAPSPWSGPSIPGGGTINLPVLLGNPSLSGYYGCHIPPGVQAYSFNLTVVPKAGGPVNYVSVWPYGLPQPIVSTLNDSQGMIVANAAIVPAGGFFNDGSGGGGISVFNAGPATTDVIIDINGYFASQTDTQHNTSFGAGAGSPLAGSLNTAIGENALFNIGIMGSNNIALGYSAAYNVSGSNNIEIGSQGSASDSGTIRIGTTGTVLPNGTLVAQTSFFAAGVRGVTTGNNNAVPVVIDSNGQLGTVNSSRRFKEDIEDMGDASSGLLRLRPVTFRYRQPFADGSRPIEYGLIAEEVEEVYPDLVAHSADGQIETVKYQVLDSMLLNEAQKQATQIRRQGEQIRQLTEQNRQLRQQAEQIRALEDRFTALEALRPAAPEPVR